MTPTSREVIDRSIIGAIQESGSVGVRVPDPAPHPRKYLIVHHERQISVWVYCWTLTHGGRPSLPNEFRIQMTSVQSPLQMNSDGPTVLLGYDPNREVFAGYDISRHSTFTTGSPSVQINGPTLNRALQNGIAFQVKSNNEVAVGVRSDLLLYYFENAVELHHLGNDPTYLETVTRAASSDEITETEIQSLTPERQLIVGETTRWSRSSTFRKQVLNAYENRCAVTRRKLNLVDAAHILPVSAGSQSIDHVNNGIALSPTYHRAFDHGLIFLGEDMAMHLNTSAVDELSTLGLDSGIDGFAAHLGEIHLPYHPDLRPDPSFIQLANEYRGLSTP